MIKKHKISPIGVILGTVISLYTILLFALMAWILIVSVMNPMSFDIDRIGNKLPFPNTTADFSFDNYAFAFKNIRKIAKIDGGEYYIYLPEMFLNSILYAGGGAFFATLSACLVAYVTAKYKMRFNKVIYMTVIFVMITPIVGNLPSQLEMAKSLGFIDSHAGQWFMGATFLGTYYLVFYSIFKGLSWEYAEAALIDGASHFTLMMRIMLPLVKNTFLVIFVLNFIGKWNDYQAPLLFMPNRPVAASGIYHFYKNGENNTRHPTIILAGGMCLLIPALILFVAFKEKMIGNLSVGGLKG